MRTIHSIHLSEQVIAKGAYEYVVSGKPNGCIETWQITQLPDGQTVVRADVDASSMDGGGSHMVSHMVFSDRGDPAWLRVRYGDANLGNAAQYTFNKATVQIVRKPAGYGVRQEVVDIAEDYGIDYPPVIGHDYPWRRYGVREPSSMRAIPIFSPDFWEEGGSNLTGRVVRFRITPMGTAPCEVPAGLFEEAARFDVVTDDGVKAQAWFDEQGIPLRWVYPDKGYEFILRHYQPAA